MAGRRHDTDQPHAFFNEVDRGAMQFEAIIAALVPLEHEAAALSLEQSGFVDPCPAQSVASIARAARSGSSAWVIGRPITRMEAP